MDYLGFWNIIRSFFKGEISIERCRANLNDAMDDNFLYFSHDYQMYRLKSSHTLRAVIQAFICTFISFFVLFLCYLLPDELQFIGVCFTYGLLVACDVVFFIIHRLVFNVISCEYGDNSVKKQYRYLFWLYVLLIAASMITARIFNSYMDQSMSGDKFIRAFILSVVLMAVPYIILHCIYLSKVEKTSIEAKQKGLYFSYFGDNRIDPSKDFQIILKNQDVITVDLRSHFVHIRMDQSLHVGILYPKRGETYQYQVYFTKDITCVTIKDTTLCYYPSTGWIKV